MSAGSLSSSHTTLSCHGEPFQWQMLRLLSVKRLTVKLSQWGLYESSKNHVANVWLLSSLFSETLLPTLHFPLSGWLGAALAPWESREGALAQKGFCWPSSGWPEHALERGASLAMAEGTASPTYSSLKRKQRGFCCPRQLLLVWKHLVLLVLPSLASPQTAEGLQSSHEEQKPLQSASKWLYSLEKVKIFLSWFCGGWLLDKYPKNLIRKTCRGGFHGRDEPRQCCKALLLMAPVLLWPGSWGQQSGEDQSFSADTFPSQFFTAKRQAWNCC